MNQTAMQTLVVVALVFGLIHIGVTVSSPSSDGNSKYLLSPVSMLLLSIVATAVVGLCNLLAAVNEKEDDGAKATEVLAFLVALQFFAVTYLQLGRILSDNWFWGKDIPNWDSYTTWNNTNWKSEKLKNAWFSRFLPSTDRRYAMVSVVLYTVLTAISLR